MRIPLARGIGERNLDVFEMAVLVVLAALSAWVLALDLWQVVEHGRVWTGTDGEFPQDQLQYIAWIRDASRHLLASDLFVARHTPHDFLEPLVVLASGLVALGLAPSLALLLFQPVAVVALFLAVREYCGRALRGRWERRGALVLALFFASFGVLGDEWIPFLTWGYAPAVFAIAAMAAALVAYDRARMQWRARWAAPALGLLCSWLHPWQGEELLLVVVGGELAMCDWQRARPAQWLAWLPGRRRAQPPHHESQLVRHQRLWRRRLMLPAVTMAATALPLAYYGLLARTDPTWRLAESAGAKSWALAVIVFPLAPLLIAAALGWFGKPVSFIAAATKLWPLACLAVYELCEHGLGTGPLHAFGGVTIPLAILAVQGAQRMPLRSIPAGRWLAALTVVAFTLPGTIHMMGQVPHYVGFGAGDQNFITPGEQSALEYIARDPERGAVLAPYSLGTLVPAYTGRATYTGDNEWSIPSPARRQRLAWRLFYQDPSRRETLAWVRQSGAHVVLVPCGSDADLRQPLAPITASLHRFGCASVLNLTQHQTHRSPPPLDRKLRVSPLAD